MHAFLSNLANQTDRQTSRAIAFTSSVVGGNHIGQKKIVDSGCVYVNSEEAVACTRTCHGKVTGSCCTVHDVVDNRVVCAGDDGLD